MGVGIPDLFDVQYFRDQGQLVAKGSLKPSYSAHMRDYYLALLMKQILILKY
jgi:hypothetical protein